MQSVLAIVLSLGNYLNVDTKFGCAYGFKVGGYPIVIEMAIFMYYFDS